MEHMSYDPPTLALLRGILDQAANEHPEVDKLEMAARVLRCAADGERDPRKLKAAAIVHEIRP